MPAVWPRNSVLFFTCGFSGFQMRKVRSAEPVAMRWPVGFHAMVRILEDETKASDVDLEYKRKDLTERKRYTCGSLDRGSRDHGMFGS